MPLLKKAKEQKSTHYSLFISLCLYFSISSSAVFDLPFFNFVVFWAKIKFHGILISRLKKKYVFCGILISRFRKNYEFRCNLISRFNEKAKKKKGKNQLLEGKDKELRRY